MRDLTRQYRPGAWDEIVGQEVLVKTLQKEIETKAVGQAYLFSGPRGTGKAQPLDAEILTSTGYKLMKDMKVGDAVFGEDGKIHHVVGVYPQGKKQVYRIWFSDRTSTECCIDHLWNVRPRLSSRHYKTVSVRWLLNQQLRTEKQEHSFEIPVALPLEFESSKELPLDPYLLGVLIGDGGLTGGGIEVSLYETDIYEKVSKLVSLYQCNLEPHTVGSNDYDITSNVDGCNYIRRALKLLDLFGKKSTEKHIPKEYLFGSIADRTKLLQGLFDTDGCVENGTLFTFSTSSEQLMVDMKFLLQSLGCTCTVVPKKNCGYKDTDGNFVNCANSWRFTIKTPKHLEIFTSKKHYSRYKEYKHKVFVHKYITEIEYVGEKECQCIMTDNLTGLYLTNDCIVTHNTTTARVFASVINAQVIELDGASHNGVEHIRDLRNDVLYQPTDGKSKKLYIIDECHMMTTAAQNAFLKVLEEPPAHVIFVLATTDPQKILPTIMSRVQRFELTRIAEADIISRLNFIAEREGITIDGVDTLEYIAKSVDGGMRDAIKLLQKCSSLDEVITKKTVIDALGSVDPARIKSLVSFILSKDVTNTVKYFNRLVSDGVDIRILFGDIVSYLTEEMRSRVVNQDYDIGAELELASKLADFLGTTRNTTQLKVLAELKLIQLCCNLEGASTGSTGAREENVSSETQTQASVENVTVPVQVEASEELMKQVKEELEAGFRDKFDIIFMQLDNLKYKR
jgi:DNA polymerase III subunit gamma/tau